MFTRMHRHRWLILIGLALVSAGFALRTDESFASSKSIAKAAPAAGNPKNTVKVEKGPFRIETTLKGVFEAAKMTEVSLRPQTALALTVATAVEPGAVVKKGDTLVTFETDKADRAVRDLEAEKDLADLRLKQAEEELKLLERSTQLELESAEKAKKQADEDLKVFLDTDKAIAVKSANFGAKSTADSLEYTKEELKQLQKMYRHKDLTEETEEIILKRQRNQVEQMEFALQRALLRRDHTLTFEIPRREQSLRDGARRAALTLEKAKSSLPLTLSQKRLALVKAKYDHAKAAKQFERLRKDRDSLTVRSPADGVVYYGRCVRGQWSSAGDVARRLVQGGSVSPTEVFMTIVDPQTLVVRAEIEEKNLTHIHPDLAAKVTPAALPELRLPGKVKSVVPVPLGPGRFECRLDLEPAAVKDTPVIAGMGCTVKLVPYRKADALTVPKTAVFREDDDEAYVYVSQDDKPQKRVVKTGRSSGERIEIIEGLSAGELVLLSKP